MPLAMPIEDMDKTEQIIKWLFEESITIEEIEEMESMNVEWYVMPDVPDDGIVCGDCGGMDIALSVMTSVNPNGKNRKEQMEELFDEAEYEGCYCYTCDDSDKSYEDIKYIRGEEMIGSMVKVKEIEQAGLVVGVKHNKIREEDEHYVREGYVSGHYEVLWAGETEPRKAYEDRSHRHPRYKLYWMNQTEEVA